MVESSAKWMGSSSNIRTHLRRQAAMLLSLDQSMNELVSEALKPKPWRSSCPYLETFPLCDTAICSCSKVSITKTKKKDEEII